MSRKKTKKTRRSSVRTLVFLVLAVSFLYTVVTQEFDARSKRAELESINNQIAVEETEKKALAEQAKTVNTPEYIESVARNELGYAAPDEIVFIDATAHN